MIFETRQTESGSWAVYKDGKRYSDFFSLNQWTADLVCRDLERAFLDGADHGEGVKEIQRTFAHLEEICPDCMATPLTPNGICTVCQSKVAA